MDRAQFGQNTRTYITEYIRFGDAKAGAIIGAVSALLAALGVFSKEFLTTIGSVDYIWRTTGTLCGAIVAVSSVLTLWHSVQALSPKTPAANASLASFPDIARMPPAVYSDKVIGLDAEGMASEYAAVNSTLARIAASKFSSIARAVWWFRIMLLGSTGVVLLYVVRLAMT